MDKRGGGGVFDSTDILGGSFNYICHVYIRIHAYFDSNKFYYSPTVKVILIPYNKSPCSSTNSWDDIKWSNISVVSPLFVYKPVSTSIDNWLLMPPFSDVGF